LRDWPILNLKPPVNETSLTAKHAWSFTVFLLQNRFLALVYYQISTDLDTILHTPIAARNTLVGRLRPPSASGRLQAKPERQYFFCNRPTCNAP